MHLKIKVEQSVRSFIECLCSHSGLLALTAAIQQRKSPLRSLNLQSCSISHKSLHGFHTALTSNNNLIKYLQVINLTGNRIKDENVRRKDHQTMKMICMNLVCNSTVYQSGECLRRVTFN